MRILCFSWLFLMFSHISVWAQNPCHHPSEEFVAFTREICDMGYKSDHERLLSKGLYSYLNNLQPFSVNNEKFYKPALPYSRLCWYDELHRRSEELSTDILYNPQCIWAYFYRDTIDDEMIEDGVFEEWIFTDDEEAEKAYQVMREVSYLMYFNTMPYCIKYKNKIYVLHTRAMAFSFPQREVYDKLVDYFEGR